MDTKISEMPVTPTWRKSKQPLNTVFPFSSSELSYWFNGRVSIFQGVNALGIGASDRVLVPAYCCGSEVDAVKKSGAQIDFYRVRPDLTPDMDHLETLCQQPAKALLVIHYFGFPQSMQTLRKFAEQHNLLLIEDNAHGLFSCDETGTALGTLGDISIFSFVKSLPLPDGGGLQINRPEKIVNKLSQGKTPGFLGVAGKVKYLCERAARLKYPVLTKKVKEGFLDPAISLLKGIKRTLKGKPPKSAPSGKPGTQVWPDDLEKIELRPEQLHWRMSNIARRLILGSERDFIVQARRRNFQYLLDHFPKDISVQPLLTELPEHCCPLLFPVRSDDALEFKRFLIRNDVGCKYFWTYFHPMMPQEEFEFETRLKNSIVVLPVHQNLNTTHMQTILETIQLWEKSNQHATRTATDGSFASA